MSLIADHLLDLYIYKLLAMTKKTHTFPVLPPPEEIALVKTAMEHPTTWQSVQKPHLLYLERAILCESMVSIPAPAVVFH